MTCICPKCGHNLSADERVYRDGWMIDPVGRFAFRGPALPIRATWANILHAIASTSVPITPEALLNRVSVTERTNTIAAQICQLRRWLREGGFPDPILTHRGLGYGWNEAAGVRGDGSPVTHEARNAA